MRFRPECAGCVCVCVCACVCVCVCVSVFSRTQVHVKLEPERQYRLWYQVSNFFLSVGCMSDIGPMSNMLSRRLYV